MRQKFLLYRNKKISRSTIAYCCIFIGALSSHKAIGADNVDPPVLTVNHHSSTGYDIAWNSGYSNIKIYESPNGTASWSLKYDGNANSSHSADFNYPLGGTRYYRARGCAFIVDGGNGGGGSDGNVSPKASETYECSGYSQVVSANVTGNSSKPTTAVVLGDSFSSGEGGRWRGNTNDEDTRFSGYMGTDSAGFLSDDLPSGHRGNPVARWDEAYESNSISNACHRAYSAPIHQLAGDPYFPIPPFMIRRGFEKTVNLACSGARNKHLWPVAEGGDSFKGEEPQITQLSNLNLTHDVKLIVVGIGGNDMGFSAAIGSCVKAWFVKHWGWELDNWVDDQCYEYIADETIPALWDVYGKTALTINMIRQEMLRQGKTDPDDYRIVLMGYPDIIAGFGDNRYESGDRRSTGKCPFNGEDSRFVVDTLLPKLNGMYETLAHEEQVDFINPKDLFQGHKLCQMDAARASYNKPANPGNMEWVRYIDHDLNTRGAVQSLWDALVLGEVLDGVQGRIQESMHPNQFGQVALGSCLNNWWTRRGTTPAPYRCDNSNPSTNKQVKITGLPAPSYSQISSDNAIPDAELLGEAYPGGPDEYRPGELRRSFVVADSGQNEPGRMARVLVRIDHPAKGDLRIFLRSPSGVEHLIKGHKPTDLSPFPSVWRSYLTHAAWQPGEWSLVIRDTKTGHTGTFRDFKVYWY
ncbi:proprotein convertase P-domain-containing protein [Microbulbifer taiwanensis]|uniref:Proprotein convertase P-domain-containing protein n=1 Tax=Microbulbifer taiwanensis TaxID=986746 RepID=A0ABW1YRI0_9GAMM|nr:proprotein convertase P-domain-containing protein [Microbulbifer taiwanensis]